MSLACVHPSAKLGAHVEVAADAFVGPNCYVEGHTTIGSGARLIAGVTLIGDIRIENGCILEPNVSTTAILATVVRPTQPLVIGAGTRIGAGSVLSCGLTIGPFARIGAGTIVTRNVPAHAIVSGNPASIVGYATSSSLGNATSFRMAVASTQHDVADCAVNGVRLHKFPRIRDLRGDLSVGEFGKNVPFRPERYFLVYDVPSAETRGEHAHRVCEQFLVCVSGRLAVVVDDGAQREEIELDAPDVGLYIPPRVWALQYKYTRTSVLLVFASHRYDPGDYIRDYAEFLRECGRQI